jgi:hypothetical protein
MYRGKDPSQHHFKIRFGAETVNAFLSAEFDKKPGASKKALVTTFFMRVENFAHVLVT